MTWDEDIYNFKHERRGLAVIMNNEHFKEKNREGSSEDLFALKHTFQELGFDVLDYTDLEAWKMIELLDTGKLHSDSLKV